MSEVRAECEGLLEGEGMSGWMFEGYVKDKVGTGRHTKFIEYHDYKCLHCGYYMRVERTQKPPRYCPKCGDDKKGAKDEL